MQRRATFYLPEGVGRKNYFNQELVEGIFIFENTITPINALSVPDYVKLAVERL